MAAKWRRGSDAGSSPAIVKRHEMGSPVMPATAQSPAAVERRDSELPVQPARPSAATTSPQIAVSPLSPEHSLATGSTPDAVILHFQRLMSQFLQTQEKIMTAYLNSGELPAVLEAGFEAPDTETVPVAVVKPRAPIAVQPSTPIETLDAPKSSPAAKQALAAGARDIAGELIQLVSSRTGYPTEMLQMDSNIEADLGIDSIKRVEILSAFQKNCSADEQSSIQAAMDKLTKRKTLRELAQAITDALHTIPSTGAPANNGTNGTQSSAHRDFAQQLIGIVSSRTGYPTEMLQLDSNIEADLGIDSIKRVEILSAFQKSCSPDEQRRIQTSMDKLTKRKTLRELAQAIADAFGAAESSTAAPVNTNTNGYQGAAPRDLTHQLIGIVSSRTGYPAEMLQLDSNIEADLGIDSIKRVEILSAFQKSCSTEEQGRISPQWTS